MLANCRWLKTYESRFCSLLSSVDSRLSVTCLVVLVSIFPLKSWSRPGNHCPLPPLLKSPNHYSRPWPSRNSCSLISFVCLSPQLRASTNFQYFRNADALPCRHAGTKNRNVGTAGTWCVCSPYLQLKICKISQADQGLHPDLEEHNKISVLG